ncbi:MAG: 4-phosphopantetheinyl transferase, partial [Chromatiaceae bacterium]|nr:4-phosphopantetheinyl transferase [Chromatiaceae bacterium]
MLTLNPLPWVAASPAPLLGPQDLQIWIIPCGADNGDPEALCPLLSGAEQARADRRLAPGHRAAYIRAHAGLRLILAAPLATPPARIEFQQGPQGKPAVAGPLEFNLTTSGDLALVALRWHQPVGIDCERLTNNRNLLAIARRLFSPDEVQRLVAADAAERPE